TLHLYVCIHCIILFIGGHYTYAQVPLFDTLKELLHQQRNNYDKLKLKSVTYKPKYN
ncbi:MAG: DUF2238 domain-containing protein, partial [Sphingobacteriaceae bacterium]